MKTIKEGDKAPNFSLPADSSDAVSLKDFAGSKNIVLYFYPKDNTPGCTVEACNFRDSLAKLKSSNTVVLGVSRDSLQSHNKFKEKYRLSFPLLSDKTGKICELYGCWIEKSMFGKKYMGIERSTFLINKKGIVKKIWRKVKVGGHADEVLQEIKKL